MEAQKGDIAAGDIAAGEIAQAAPNDRQPAEE
jgi:hypothetical protein